MTPMAGRRKHVRISHEDTVHFNAAGEAFEARSVDLSRSGMRIVARLPASHNEIETITFKIPSRDTPLHIPVRAVRAESKPADGRENIIGIEFDFDRQAEMVLIEEFIRERKQRQIISGGRDQENRTLPRVPCSITEVETDHPDISEVIIDDISTEGVLISFTGELDARGEIELALPLPGVKRLVKGRGTVAYVIRDRFARRNSAGVRFTSISTIDATRIKNFILASSSSASLRALHRWFESKKRDNQSRLSNPKEIRRSFDAVVANGIEIHFMLEGSFEIFEARPEALFPHSSDGVLLRLDAPALAEAAQPGTDVRGSFLQDGGGYFFTGRVVRQSGDALDILLPELLFRSEKRSYTRRADGFDRNISLTPGRASGKAFDASLLDISQRGFLCEVEIPPETAALFAAGNPVVYRTSADLNLKNRGEIRHVEKIGSENGNITLRLGVEAGVKRNQVSRRTIDLGEWEQQQLYTKEPPAHARTVPSSQPVKYTDEAGREIRALLNSNGLDHRATVVVLPPAFGKKKEALAPLVCVLLANFTEAGHSLVTLRYDGINRPGESYNSIGQAKRGYEMLHYRISQGRDDLQATLDFCYDNPFFTPDHVVLVTFSMSALDARKVLVDQRNRDRVSFWVSAMGVPAAQTALRNTLGGIDIISNYKMGIPTGTCGLLGHLVNMDTIARDLVEHKYAYITDARLDMSQVKIPVLWIYGNSDRWVTPEEVDDVMSVGASEGRYVVEIPAGHNLRTSDDAVKTFKLITSHVFWTLFDEVIEPIDSDRDAMVRLVSYERERLEHKEELEKESYWHNYLIGSGEGESGYDFYRNLVPFTTFLKTEVEMLDPQPGEHVGDLGCGTGLFLEELLTRLGSRNRSPHALRGTRVTAVDLVPDALEKAREKANRTVRTYPSLADVELSFHQRNLEPNRLIPIDVLIKDPGMKAGYLRGKVEGLTHAMMDRLERCSLPFLGEALRGDPLSEEQNRALQTECGSETAAAVRDIGRSARFLRGELLPEERNGTTPEKTQDLTWETLEFANAGRKLNLDFPDASFDRISASLFISYLFDPEQIVRQFYRMLKPGGRLLLSSMRPDSDISVIFTDFIEQVARADGTEGEAGERNEKLEGARAMLNEAASLFELEEDGYFRFFTAGELETFVRRAGFTLLETRASLGEPTQAVIITAEK